MKRLVLMVLLILSLGLTSCNFLKFEAYVTIVNIGSLDMIASVDDDEQRINAYSSATWSIRLDSEDQVVVLDLYAEPVTHDDYDDAVVTLYGDRDIQTWLTGWDAAALAQGKPVKKEGYILDKAGVRHQPVKK